uniref:Probable cytosolic iron-sulfur protein assembly protein CIAO1 homolog n=1 Tax=Aplanochytrium stocchinoi TaxID=215587 RepID=A0A7S3LQT2_9STRA
MSIVECVNLEGHAERVWHVCWSPCGKILASCGAEKGVRIWTLTEEGREIVNNIENEDDNEKRVTSVKQLERKHWVCACVLDEVQSRTIRSCEFSPNGEYLAAASFDSTTAIWTKQGNSVASWKCLTSLEGHENEVKSVSWSHDGRYLATSSRDKSVWVWGVPEKEINSQNTEYNDKDDDMEEEWDCITVLHGHTQDVKFVCWSPIENVLYSASYDDTIKIWAEEVDDWGCLGTLVGHTNTVWGISFHPSGNMFASCSQDYSIRIWENIKTEIGHTWQNVQVLKGTHDRTVFSVHWAKFGMIATCGADDRICTYTCQRLQSPPVTLFAKKENAHMTDVNCVRWNPVFEGMLASASDDTAIKIWCVTKNAT